MARLELLGLKHYYCAATSAPRTRRSPVHVFVEDGPTATLCSGKGHRGSAFNGFPRSRKNAHLLQVWAESSVPSGSVQDDTVAPPFPFVGDGSLQEAEQRLPVVNEPGTWSEIHTNLNWYLELLEKDIDKIENVISNTKEEIYEDDEHFNNLFEIQHKMERLNIEFHEMQALLDSKEKRLSDALQESLELKRYLREAELQISSLNMYKEGSEAMQDEIMLELQRASYSSLQILDRHMAINQALNNTHQTVEDVKRSIITTYPDVMAVKVIEMLQKEATLSIEALLLATTELEKEKVTSADLLSRWQSTVAEMENKKLQVAELTKELEAAKQYSNTVSEELVRAEGQVSALNQKLANTESSLAKETQALSSAREGLQKLEQVLIEEESKVDDLFKEVSFLKAQFKEKENKVQELSEEAMKNKGLSEAATKNLNAFRESEKKVEQLTNQCHILENQIRSRDDLLEEIKEETCRSTEALRLATQIKQDLNESRQREVKLMQELEKQSSYVEELRQKLTENSRAARAELALRQAEKNAMDLMKELDILKNGIKSRNEVIKLLEEKIDGNIDILKTASENRETMKKMQIYINELELKLKGLNMLQHKPQSFSIK